MLNFKCKSYRGRSPENRTDALVIVECTDKIDHVFAKVIPNKEANTIVPIICENVAAGTIIFTDEHKGYSSLVKMDIFIKKSVINMNLSIKVAGLIFSLWDFLII
ncbi:hypothetical protein H312_02564 [Anncaliia algerae PRA339]|uniref:ISXO2-like transposase domain-containing protein n=1 Tax=Anncaliia algerae PRA339 TaxID=1288291 RepID=A0A059EZD2_9MICR|nr:hypothetical protein H312_02564 [Anncaliia algerae PRA339]